MINISALTAIKAAAAVLTDEKSRRTIVTSVLSIVAAVLMPLILLLTLLALPMGGLSELLDEDGQDTLSAWRGVYGLDQYVGDADYLAGEGLDYSGVSFTDGQTTVHYYSQLDSRWKDIAYGDGTIGRSGCGPTSLAIAVSSLTGEAVDPIQMSAWAYEKGYKAYGNGSYHSLIPEGAEHFGLTVDYATSADAQKIADALADGKLVIAIMGPGHFTKGGHYIVLRGVTADGKILVADPASTSRSEQEWNIGIVLSEARQDAGAGGPFWILSA